MSKADMLGGSATFDAVTQPMSSRAAAFARFSGQETPDGNDASTTRAGGLRLAVAKLAHNPYNPREELQDIEDLADSLAARGLIQPVTVVTRAAFLAAHPGHEHNIGDSDFVVVDGNRRLAAAAMAGLDSIPAHLDDSLAEDADTLLETALVAAVHNKELEPIAQARVLEKLVAKYGSQRQVAKALHKSSGWVTQRMALLKLTPELQQAVEDKSLPVEVARQVGQLPQQQQNSAAQEALAARAARKPRRSPTPPTAKGAYAVSTPAQPTGGVDQVDASETSAAEAQVGAYGVSTSRAAEHPPEVASSGGGGQPLSLPALRQEDSRPPRMPWHDGNAVMDLVLAALDDEQRARFLHRYVERSGSKEALVADLARGLPQGGRLQLASILAAVAADLQVG
ncbi:ParB/RepB/Spo0J family partition protein [Streptomyces sp. 3211]|uniref:ParB/RepB/Spo0J family partition protein n=1 Tax=Streptomyces sp. 3211 TaxID=1964449 RepID=UPI0009A51710|nr:ParB/RepB/Spo0J family partition protein [Streptomyces sp. 3211]